MSSAITDVDTFTSPVTVPDPGDPRALAAEAVAAIAQALCNRTLNLKNLDLLKAVLTASNEFTAAPQKVTAIDNGVPQFEVTKSSLDDTTFPGNGWKMILQCDSDGTGRKLRLYSGGNDSSGMLAITVNSFWHVSDSHWRQDNSGKASFALFVFNEGVTISRQVAGAGSWSAWPPTLGELTVGNTVTAGVLNAGSINSFGAVSAAGALNSFADCNVSGNVVTAGEVLYPLPSGFKLRTSLLNLADGLSGGNGPLIVDSNGNVAINTATVPSEVHWGIRLPRGAQLLKAEFIHGQSSAAPSSVDVRRRAAANYGTPSVPNFLTIGGSTAGPASTGTKLTVCDFTLSPVSISADEEYRAIWSPGNPGTGNDIVEQIRLTWNDPGPRNG